MSILNTDIGAPVSFTSSNAALTESDIGKLVGQDPANNDKMLVQAAEAIPNAILETVGKDGRLTCVMGKFVTVLYTGGAPGAGASVELVANGSGGVKTPAVAGTGRKYMITNQNTGATKVTFFLPAL